MINNWLSYNVDPPKPTFTVVMVSEKQIVDAAIKTALQKEILNDYKSLGFLKMHFKSETKDKLEDYLERYVLPSNSSADPLSKNVWQGDFGEILTSLIVAYFQGLTVPIKKMRWKFNKDRSVFCTDMIAHNSDKKITDLYYYEIKTRENLSKKESINGSSSYITIHAHNSLLKDQNSSPEGIANFLASYYYDCSEKSTTALEIEAFLKKSLIYGDIAKNSGSYDRHYELFFIGEKGTYINNILDDLNSLPPQLSPLNVTMVLIDNFKDLVADLRKTISQEAVNIIHNT